MQFERLAEQSPQSIAVIDRGVDLTYAQLNARANQLAHHLRGLDNAGEEPVGIFLERSIEMIVAVLAVLKAGLAYVPLSVEQPAARVAYFLQDANPSFVITDSINGCVLPKNRFKVVYTDVHADAIARCPTINIGEVAHLDAVAYCIFTSGSTGRPKAVQVTHGGIAAIAQAQASWFRTTPSDRVLQFASFAFDAFVFEMVMALTAGAALVLRGQHIGSALAAEMEQQRISIVTLPPSLLARMDLRNVSTLRVIISAGEACGPNAMQAIPLGCEFVNAYGPTEATIWATAYRRENDEVRALPIGRPIPNARVYLLDESLNPVPIGVPGEIHIGGAGVARGYLGRPELTAEKFIPNPFGAAGSRMYKTGDLGRYLADGNIEFLGRIDHQVKIRGFRVELGEIEHALLCFENVREAVVVAREDEPGNKRLVAYVVPRGPKPTADALRGQLQQLLPEYMLPASWTFLDSLPLNSNGKIDRNALPSPECLVANPADTEYVAPRTEVERLLASLWESVLRVGPIGVHDNFLALGGNSLLAVHIVNRIEQLLGIRLPSNCMQQWGEVANVAAALESQVTAVQTTVAVDRGELSEGDATSYPATSAQLQVRYFSELYPENNAYQAQSATRIHGPLDLSVLKQVLDKIVLRHEHLRTTYHLNEDGELVGQVHPGGGDFYSYVDLTGHAHDEVERVLQEEVERITTQCLDPATLPLVRWTMFRIAEDQHVLAMLEHHYIHDGWSFRLYLSELAKLYTQKIEGDEFGLPTPTQFGAYATYQKNWLSSNEANVLRERWRTYLDGVTTVLRLPVARARVGQRSMSGGQLRTTLGAPLMARVVAAAQRLGATPFQFMFAAFSILVSRYTGRYDFVLGTSVANRVSQRWESVIGMLVNVVPVRVSLERDISKQDAVARVREALMAATALGELPFPEIVAAVGARAGDGSLPLLQVQFSAHNSLDKRVEIPGLTLDVAEALPNGSSKFDLAVTCIPDDELGNTELLFEYSSDLFDVATVNPMMAHYRAALEEILVDGCAPVSDSSWATNDAEQRLLTAWNDTDAAYVDVRPVHVCFQEQVTKSPHATAVICDEQALTFEELNTQANRLAHYLIDCGVGRETAVGLCVDRGPRMVVALLAILKAGGAYVPLDASHPPGRLRYIVSDSKPAMLLVDGKGQDALGADPLPVPTLRLHEEAHRWSDRPASNPSHANASPRQLAYVIYTSGSTGRPKGTMVEHAQVFNLWKGLENSIFANHASLRRVSINAALAFDASVQQLVQLLSGRAIVIVPEEIRRDAHALMEYIDRWEVDVLDCTPSLLEALLSARTEKSEKYPRVVLAGGDAISPSLWGSLIREPGIAFYNVYGPTECTVDTTTARVQPTVNGSPIIGRPIPNAQVYLLDESLNPVPIGVPGEIHIGGAGVARGYLGRPELTAEKFIPNPFGAAGSRMYKTGDLGRYLADGNIEFLGRIDHQVKIRGFRVELGEIEHALLCCENVREAVVVAREDEPGDKRLVAYVVPRGPKPTADALRGQLQQLLPEYMLPASWTFLDSLPLNSNGKIDRNALPSPIPATQVRGSAAGVPSIPATETTTEILRFMEAIAPSRAMTPDCNFHDVGLHSLDLMRLVARCRTRFKVRLTISEAAAAECAGSLAQLVDRRSKVQSD